MKVNMEGFKAMLGMPNKNEVRTPLYDTMVLPSEETVKPLMVEEDQEGQTIEKVPFVSVMLYQHSTLIGLDDHGLLWRLEDGSNEWKQMVSPLRKADRRFNNLLRDRML